MGACNTSLNKVCPKVPFPLPRIDQIVDSTVGCELLSFLDAYSGYHQIKMKESDQLATSFVTHFGMYCYVTMPFGLRNAGATYQRCMLHVFGGETQPREVRVWSPSRHAFGLHCLSAGHCTQP